MTYKELPPLPEPYHGFYAAPMYSADQMRAYARQALAQPADIEWRKLYRRAINEANGLTNYVEDRPALRGAERRLTAIEAEARTLAAAGTPAKEAPPTTQSHP